MCPRGVEKSIHEALHVVHSHFKSMKNVSWLSEHKPTHALTCNSGYGDRVMPKAEDAIEWW
jgi:hypothetical protein